MSKVLKKDMKEVLDSDIDIGLDKDREYEYIVMEEPTTNDWLRDCCDPHGMRNHEKF